MSIVNFFLFSWKSLKLSVPPAVLTGMFSEAEADCCSPLRRARPYKVCGGRRRERKGMVASTFQELVEKAKKKFPEAGDDLTLVLLEDKTEIDDEEYFQSLPDNTLFLVVPTSHPPRGRQRTRNCDKSDQKYSPTLTSLQLTPGIKRGDRSRSHGRTPD